MLINWWQSPHRVANYDLTCDIASETFLKTFLNINKFKWRGISISFWIYRIATNEIRQYYRKNKYTPKSLEFLIDTSGWDKLNNLPSIDDLELTVKETDMNNEFNNMQKNIQKLSVKYQEVLILKYFEQKRINEIALILSKNENTVKSLLSRGIEKLKKILK